MAIRFCILKDVKGEEKLMLEYNSDLLKNRIQRLVRENFVANRPKKKLFGPEEVPLEEQIYEAAGKAWDDLVAEFKEQTIKLK